MKCRATSAAKKYLGQHFLFSHHFNYVLHYGPLDYSKNEEEVFSWRYPLPDETWHEPNPEDPLSLIDKVLAMSKGYELIFRVLRGWI